MEKIVLGIFTVFSLAMSVSAFLLEWSILAKEVIAAAVIAGWIVCLKEYRNYAYRAKFISLMCWINFFVYAIYSSSKIIFALLHDLQLMNILHQLLARHFPDSYGNPHY